MKCSVTYCTWHDRLNKIFLHVLYEVYLMFAYCSEITRTCTGYTKSALSKYNLTVFSLSSIISFPFISVLFFCALHYLFLIFLPFNSLLCFCPLNYYFNLFCCAVLLFYHFLPPISFSFFFFLCEEK